MSAPTPLDCDGFADRLDTALDERRDPANDSALTAHAARCPGCARTLRLNGRLMAGLRVGGAAQATASWKPSSDWQAPTVGSRDKQTKRPLDRRWLGVAGGAAAAMLVATAVLTTRPGADSGRPEVVQPGLSTTVTSVGPETSTQTRPVRWDGYSATLQDWRSRIDPQGTGLETIESSVEPIAAGIRPIGGSFGAVLSGLRRTVPVGRQKRERPDTGAWIAGGVGGVA